MTDKDSKTPVQSKPANNKPSKPSENSSVAPATAKKQPVKKAQPAAKARSSVTAQPDTKTESAPTAEPRPAAQPAQTQPAQKSGGKGLSIFAILISLLAIAASAFTWYQTQLTDVREESRLAVGVSEIGTEVARIGDQVSRLQQDQQDVVGGAELQSQLLGLKTELDGQIRDLGSGQEAVQESILKLNADLARGVDQFTVEEVSQLLRLANNSVLFGNDLEAAKNALTLADNQLKSLRDPRFAAVRSVVNQELAQLENVSLPDTNALSAQINTLSSAIASLPLANEPTPRKQEQVAKQPEGETTLRGELKKIWQDLIGSVSIQRVDQPPKPLLVPEQRYFLNQNISLALSKADLALLQGQPEVYKRSLEDAQTWLRDYFDLSNPQVASTLQQLEELSAQTVTIQIPAITGSYQALQSILGGL